MNRILSLATGLVMACLGTVGAQPAAETSSKPKQPSAYRLSLYLLNPEAVPAPVLAKAELVTTRIFASIGISVQWHIGNERGEHSAAEVMPIEIQLDSVAPVQAHEDALGYASPYGTSGTRIHVFCERVINTPSPTLAGPYLGHVVAHEIGHVLEGISRHSVQGIMKAQWSLDDFYQMVFRPLPFETGDVELIYKGLELRSQSSPSRPAERLSEQQLTVCVDVGDDVVIHQAEAVASAIFAGIGVHIQWRSAAVCPPGPEPVRIRFNNHKPAAELPGSLALSWPYEGVHIEVFYDRVRKSIEPRAVPALLAHVFAHEIAHILEGVDHHAQSGILKAQWDRADYAQIKWKPLSFTQDDIPMIRRGIELRGLRAAAVGQ